MKREIAISANQGPPTSTLTCEINQLPVPLLSIVEININQNDYYEKNDC
jgi:hypothetical protein